jgi:isoquinoline 1-oxidoreductase alpha subunit
MVRLTVNGKTHNVDVDPSTPLLWVLREQLGLTGTKYGCGIAACGACTVHVDGAAVRSCSMPASAAVGKRVTTIEGLASRKTLHKVQKAWIDHEVPQCGYC